jgi:hypothetical protein
MLLKMRTTTSGRVQFPIVPLAHLLTPQKSQHQTPNSPQIVLQWVKLAQSENWGFQASLSGDVVRF